MCSAWWENCTCRLSGFQYLADLGGDQGIGGTAPSVLTYLGPPVPIGTSGDEILSGDRCRLSLLLPCLVDLGQMSHAKSFVVSSSS